MNVEIKLRDLAFRIETIMDQVRRGNLVDLTLLAQLDAVSKIAYEAHNMTGQTDDEIIQRMDELVSLIELNMDFI